MRVKSLHATRLFSLYGIELPRIARGRWAGFSEAPAWVERLILVDRIVCAYGNQYRIDWAAVWERVLADPGFGRALVALADIADTASAFSPASSDALSYGRALVSVAPLLPDAPHVTYEAEPPAPGHDPLLVLPSYRRPLSGFEIRVRFAV